MSLAKRLPATWRAAQVRGGAQGGKLATTPLSNFERQRLSAAIDRLRQGLPDYLQAPWSKAERQERERLVAAIDRLRLRLPDLEKHHHLAELAYKELLHRRVDRSWIFVRKFELPSFHISQQTTEEYRREALKQFQKFLDDQMNKYWWCINVDAPVAEPRKRRGPGRTGRNAATNARFEWAVLRWFGLSWECIAGLYRLCKSQKELMAAVSTIEKAATEILRTTRLTIQLPDLTKSLGNNRK
jgi:hypothetical protein